MGVSSRQDTMTVITSDVLKARPEGPKIVRKARKKNKGKTEKVVPPIWESTKVVDRLKYQLCFREVIVKGSSEVWSITEEVETLDVEVRHQKCRVVRQEKKGILHKAIATNPPRADLNLSVSFAFQDEVEPCSEVVSEIKNVTTRIRVGSSQEE